MTMKKNNKLGRAIDNYDEKYSKLNGFRKFKIPASGQLLPEEDLGVMRLKFE